MKLLVAVPAYDSKICAETARALLEEQALAHAAEIELTVRFVPGCSLIAMARNQLAGDFLATDADKLIFIDSDVSWEMGSVIKLASHKVDVVGGAYRLKQAFEAYPVGWPENGAELWAQDGLLEAACVPGGFLCISRNAFEKLREANPERTYSHYEFSGYAYFEQPFRDGKLWGEDSYFCQSWRDLGEKVWLDPELSLTHHGGNTAFPGHIGNWLKSRIQEAA